MAFVDTVYQHHGTLTYHQQVTIDVVLLSLGLYYQRFPDPYLFAQ